MATATIEPSLASGVVAGATPPDPGTPEWLQVVTASKISAITGTSPWDSQFALWHAMSGNVERVPLQSRAIERGNFLEDGILDWWEFRFPEYGPLRRQLYLERDDGREGATLDGMSVGTDTKPAVPVEVKTAARGDDWGPEGSDLIPVYYRDQLDWQLSFTNAPYGYLAALLGPGLDLKWYKVMRNQQRIDNLRWLVTLWRWSLESGIEPPLDRSPATFSTLKALHPEIEADEDVEVDVELATQFVMAGEAEREATANLTGARARMLKVMGNARRAVLGGKVVARRQANRNGVTLVGVMKPDVLAQVCKAGGEDGAPREEE